MNVPFRSALIAAPLALSLAFAAGCASKTVVDTTTAESIIAAVDKGDLVRLSTKNNVKHKFIVTKITNKALYGDDKRVVYEDIDQLEVDGKKKSKASSEEGGFWSRLF